VLTNTKSPAVVLAFQLPVHGALAACGAAAASLAPASSFPPRSGSVTPMPVSAMAQPLHDLAGYPPSYSAGGVPPPPMRAPSLVPTCSFESELFAPAYMPSAASALLDPTRGPVFSGAPVPCHSPLSYGGAGGIVADTALTGLLQCAPRGMGTSAAPVASATIAWPARPAVHLEAIALPPRITAAGATAADGGGGGGGGAADVADSDNERAAGFDWRAAPPIPSTASDDASSFKRNRKDVPFMIPSVTVVDSALVVKVSHTPRVAGLVSPRGGGGAAPRPPPPPPPRHPTRGTGGLHVGNHRRW
jgi:hypothetical protein